MKVKKLTLNETINDFTYDDELDYTSLDQSISGPESGVATGVADMLIAAINDEWETIRNYNSLMATLQYEASTNQQYDAFIKVIEDITNEENVHVGQLQELLKQVSPNANSIEQGEAEGAEQLQFRNGLLQVQSWDNIPSAQSSAKGNNNIDDVCMLTDVDDEM